MKATVILLLVCTLFSCSAQQRMSEFERMWSTLINAQSESDERAAVDEMRGFLFDYEFSYSIYALDKKGTLHNVQGSPIKYTIADIDSYELHIRKDKQHGTGKGWKPKLTYNVYVFFLE